MVSLLDYGSVQVFEIPAILTNKTHLHEYSEVIKLL